MCSYKSKLQKQVVLQSVHLNDFSPVCFTLHFLSYQNYHKKQFCRLFTWMFFPVSFILSFLSNQNAVLQSVHLNGFSPLCFNLQVFSNWNYNKKQFCKVCTRMLFPCMFWLKYLFKSKLQETEYYRVYTWLLFLLHIFFG